MCQRALPVTQTGHNNVWCGFCGAYTNTILLPINPSSTTQSSDIDLFWEIVEVVLTHSCYRRSPLEKPENLPKVLARHRELWAQDKMLQFLDKEAFFQLCSSL